MEAKKRHEEEILQRVQAVPEEQLAKVISLMDKLEVEAKSKAGYSEKIKKNLGISC